MAILTGTQGSPQSTTSMNSASAIDLDLSVMTPCLNERFTLATCIRKALETIRRLGIRGEVIIADNGRSDGSQAIAESLGARVMPITAEKLHDLITVYVNSHKRIHRKTSKTIDPEP